MYNPARTIEEAIRLCAPDEALPAGDPRWQDFSPVRGLDPLSDRGDLQEGRREGSGY